MKFRWKKKAKKKKERKQKRKKLWLILEVGLFGWGLCDSHQSWEGMREMSAVVRVLVLLSVCILGLKPSFINAATDPQDGQSFTFLFCSVSFSSPLLSLFSAFQRLNCFCFFFWKILCGKCSSWFFWVDLCSKVADLSSQNVKIVYFWSDCSENRKFSYPFSVFGERLCYWCEFYFDSVV